MQKIEDIIRGWALFAIHYQYEGFDSECKPYIDRVVKTTNQYMIVVKWNSGVIDKPFNDFEDEYQVSSFDFIVDWETLEEYAHDFLDALIENIKFCDE